MCLKWHIVLIDSPCTLTDTHTSGFQIAWVLLEMFRIFPEM